MRMNLAMARINHQPFKVRFIYQDLKKPLPHALITPADKPSVSVTPSTKIRWQIPPRGPVRMIQKTASIKQRLSWATPPQLPLRPGKCGSSFSQTTSDISCRLCANDCICPSIASQNNHTMTQNQYLFSLVTTAYSLDPSTISPTSTEYLL